MNCVYILYSAKLNRFYIGFTSDFDTRFEWVNLKTCGGAKKELNSIEPVFILTESETFDLHRKAFDMTYPGA
jgi:predicted GIY-YIG superfamily endonuclease